MRRIWYCAFLIWLVLPGLASAQTDSTKRATGPRQVRPGFDLPDSLYMTRDSIKGDIDTIVFYTARDSTVFDIPNRRMILTNEASMKFQNRELNAYRIVMDFQRNTLTAYSEDYDSVISTSLSRRRRIIRDTARVKSRGAPILKEGDTPYEGEVIVYNFKTRRGTVQLGTTEMEGGFYYGEKIKQVDTRTLFVQNGRFTTCDAPTPHYYFESPKMKVILKDQVFAEPVYLFIADVPIFALPFGVFPNHSGGRRSGIIAPNYQTQGSRGYGLTHLGYYQVFSDYFDVALRSDIYTKGGYNVEVLTQYMKRYLLGGPISLKGGYGMSRTNSEDPFTKNWLANLIIPNLNLGLFSSLNANLTFTGNSNNGNSYYRSTATNYQTALTQSVSSNASFSTSWEDLGVSFNTSYNRFQDIEKGTYSETSPSFSINKSQFFPFAPTGEQAATAERNVLQTLGMSYTISGQRQVDRTLNNDGTFNRTERYGLVHNPSISISPKLGYISLTPSFNYAGAFFFRSIQRIAEKLNDSTTVTHDSVIPGFHYVHRYDFGVNAQTTLFGVANVGIGGLKAIRHTVIPNIGLSFHPDLSSQVLGAYVDPISGREVEYRLFEKDNNADFVGKGKSARLTYGLQNDFEAKVEHEVTKDSSAEEKVKLLNIVLGSGYDVITKIFSGIALSTNSQIGTLFSVSGNANFSMYPRKQFSGADSTEATLIALHQGFVRATDVRFSLSGNFSSSTTTEGDNLDSLRRTLELKSPDDERQMMLGGQYPGPFSHVVFRPNWNISYGFTYNENYGVNGTERNFGAQADFTFSPTTNWSFSSGATYDFVGKRIVVPNLRVHRDLHCWEMSFDYRPTGNFRGFNFEIRIKADQLRDIKLTRAENSGYGEF